jgi:hypothetical protein
VPEWKSLHHLFSRSCAGVEPIVAKPTNSE